ncbi:hypothetical protein F4779DRAFT_609124 [Xylariaceae sp. FL0662B]|nr:hypothetical protein F4779DRAFT_609124 [Xylariaceae sp. FL0662B]
MDRMGRRLWVKIVALAAWLHHNKGRQRGDWTQLGVVKSQISHYAASWCMISQGISGSRASKTAWRANQLLAYIRSKKLI